MDKGWEHFYDEQAKTAAKEMGGVYRIIGSMEAALRNDSMSDAEKVEHVKYILEAFDRAKEKKRNEKSV